MLSLLQLDRGMARTGFLSGPPKSGVTSIAFATALNCARAGENAWFLCSRSKIENALPVQVLLGEAEGPSDGSGTAEDGGEGGIRWDCPSMDRISMKYVSSLSDVKWWCLRVHELESGHVLPAFVIVDDTASLLDAEAPATADVAQRTLLHLLALLKHAVAFMSERRESPCALLVCIDDSTRWFGDIKHILERELEFNAHATQPEGPRRYSVLNERQGTRKAYSWSCGIDGASFNFESSESFGANETHDGSPDHLIGIR